MARMAISGIRIIGRGEAMDDRGEHLDLYEQVDRVVRKGTFWVPLRRIYTPTALVQSVYVSVVEALARRSTPIREIGAFIRGVLTRKRAAFLRRERGRKGRRRREDLPPDLPGSGVEPVELVGLAEEDRRLARAIESLPERQRELIRLLYVEKRKKKDAAGELGVSPKTVHRDLVAALESLRDRLGEPA